MLRTGVVTSGNFPRRYPNNVKHTETLQAENGTVLIMDFSYFAVRVCGEIGVCSCDFLKITDGDGTILLDKSCGFSSDSDPESATDLFIPPNIMSETNIVRIFFQTDETSTHNGWSVTWKAVPKGLFQKRVWWFYALPYELSFDFGSNLFLNSRKSKKGQKRSLHLSHRITG